MPKNKKIALLSDKNIPAKFQKILKNKLNKYELFILNFKQMKIQINENTKFFVENLCALILTEQT